MHIKKILLISDDEELFKSFKRAFKALANFEVIEYSDGFRKKQDIIINIENKIDVDSWLWREFRTKKRALNPLIIVATEDKSSFISKNPVFDNYSYEHAYFQIPFELNELINSIYKLRPIHDDLTRKLIVDAYSRGYEYKLVSHDLKIIKGDKERTKENLLKVKHFYHVKGNKEVENFISNKIKEIEKKEQWEEFALGVKQYLQEILKRRNEL